MNFTYLLLCYLFRISYYGFPEVKNGYDDGNARTPKNLLPQPANPRRPQFWLTPKGIRPLLGAAGSAWQSGNSLNSAFPASSA
jgi:hypothetical protein